MRSVSPSSVSFAATFPPRGKGSDLQRHWGKEWWADFPWGKEWLLTIAKPLYQRERGWGEGLSNCFADSRQYLGQFPRYFLIAESNYAQPSSLEPRCSFQIVSSSFRAFVARAVQFNNQLCFVAVKIGAVTSKHFLTNKFMVFQAAVAELIPQGRFGLRVVFASFSSKLNQITRHANNNTPPLLLPREKVALCAG